MPWDAPVMTATFCVYMCFQSTRRSVNYRPMTFIDDWSYNCKHGTDIGCTGTDSGGRCRALRQPLVREYRCRGDLRGGRRAEGQLLLLLPVEAGSRPRSDRPALGLA